MRRCVARKFYSGEGRPTLLGSWINFTLPLRKYVGSFYIKHVYTLNLRGAAPGRIKFKVGQAHPDLVLDRCMPVRPTINHKRCYLYIVIFINFYLPFNIGIRFLNWLVSGTPDTLYSNLKQHFWLQSYTITPKTWQTTLWNAIIIPSDLFEFPWRILASRGDNTVRGKRVGLCNFNNVTLKNLFKTGPVETERIKENSIPFCFLRCPHV